MDGGLHKGVWQRMSKERRWMESLEELPGTEMERDRRIFNRNEDGEGSGDNWGDLLVIIRFNSSSSSCLLDRLICSLFNSFIRCETMDKRFDSAERNLCERYSDCSLP